MLTTLYIRDFALIDELSVSFDPRLTIITGETGAGKSILIGALNLVLGERASAELVRSGASKAVIEAVFTADHYGIIASLLEASGIEKSPELILRRDISSSGQSRCFINDTPCTVALLKQVGELLVDLHGQHDHQLLLQASTHGLLLDDFGRLDEEIGRYREQLRLLRTIAGELLLVKKKSETFRERRDLLNYQFVELEAAGLRENEEAELEEEINLLENAETLSTLTGELSRLLYDSEQSAYTAMSASLHLLEKLSGIDKRFESHREEALGAKTVIEEINRYIDRYASSIDFNPIRLEELRERLHLLQRLAKKYGQSLGELIGLRDRLGEELSMEENLAEEIDILEKRIASGRKELSSLALHLSERRQIAAGELETAIMDNLRMLGIPQSIFKVTLAREEDPDGNIVLDGIHYRAFEDGFDRVEFMISTNVGEQPKPLAKVASGGEISRIMLALKSALARSAKLPILVFDEIDTGISGTIAQAVGFSLKSLSRMHQIIAITHLPQIAAMADHHLTVKKRVRNERTVSEVVAIEPGMRAEEIARLISGKELSASSVLLAEELIKAGNSA